VRAKTRRRGSWHKPIRTQPDAAALEFAQAEVTAAAVKERRGDKGDDTMSGADLAAAVKFAHLKKSMKVLCSYTTTKKRAQFLGGVFARFDRAGNL
jgi:hypothetical protein